MKFGALPTLQAVVRRGNFAAAARELALTPSAISQQMRALEDYFGQPLFDRSGRSVRPTPFALEVVATVDGALTSLQALRDRSRSGVAGRLRLGVINSIQLSTLPACLKRSAQRYPDLELVLEPENTSEVLLESLNAGDVDAAVVVKPRVVSRKLLLQEVTQEPFVLLYPCDHEGAVTPEAIAQSLPWIRYNMNLEGGRMASAFVRKLVPGLQPRYEVMSGDAVVNMVSEGLGFSVVSRPRAPILAAYAVNLLKLDRQMPRRSVVLARRTADAGNRRIDAFLACLRDVYASRQG
jgi:DNA-binding transcriptional LysR family regulator